MTRLHPTRNDLPETTRAAMVDLLNRQLATAIDLALQAKQAHWNVKGPHFIALHQLFDQVHGEGLAWVDDIAERAVQLGGVADGTLAGVRDRSTLPPWHLANAQGRECVEALANALATFGRGVRAASDEAGEAGDADTSDLFTGISRGADKMLWFVEAHLHG